MKRSPKHLDTFHVLCATARLYLRHT